MYARSRTPQALFNPLTQFPAMRVALASLDVSRVHHMVDVFYNSDDAQWFMRANNAKHNPSTSPPFTKTDWDQLLGDCQGTIDMPTAFFADELIAAYPDAKVVLMQRDFNAWYKSMSATIFRSRKPNPIGRFILWLDYNETGQAGYMALEIMNAFLGLGGDEYDNVKQKYDDYFDRIRQSVPKERLLEFKLKEGFEPLCEFLDCGVPMETDAQTGKERVKSFPHINETSDYQDRMKVLYQRTAMRVLRKYVARPLGLTVVIMAVKGLVGKVF